MSKRQCVICGAWFDTPPSNNKRTCSAECSRKWRSMQHIGVHNKWSNEARERLRQKQTPPQLAQGTAAAQLLPEGQKGQQNRESMVWELITPDGSHIIAIGLEDWARRNAWRFGEAEETAYRIAAGFRQIAQSIRGKTKRRVSSHKGWGLAGEPIDKKDL